MTERSYSRLSLIILAITLVVIFHRLFLGEVFFWGLPSLQFYPWRDYAVDMLRQGQLPLWNPLSGAGAPLLANYQSALLYPLNWPSFILPLGFAMSLTAVVHLFIAGWGMWLFMGRLGLPSLAQGVSAIAFGLTSYLVARLGTYPIVTAAAWMPWIMWSTLGILSSNGWRDTGWLALFTGLQFLSGHAQTTWYTLMLTGGFSLWWLTIHRLWEWQRVILLATGVFLGMGIAAIQLLPTAELLSSSQRSGGVDLAFAMNYSFAPLRALTFLSPNIFGNPGDGSLVTGGAFFEDAVYIGFFPFVSAMAALLGWFLRRRNSSASEHWDSVPFWFGVVIVAFVFALGRYSVIFPFLFRNVPTFDLFQAPVRWHILTVFALSVLAGIGIQGWGRDRQTLKWTRRAIIGCIVAILVVVIAPRFLLLPEKSVRSVQVLTNGVIAAAVLGVVAGILSLMQPALNHPRRALWLFAVFFVIALDLGWAAWGLNPTVPASFYDRVALAGDHDNRGYWPDQEEEKLEFKTFLLFGDYRVVIDRWQEFRASQLPNLNVLDRFALLDNFDPLLVGYYADYIQLIEKNLPAHTLLWAAGVARIYSADQGVSELDNLAERAWFVPSVCWHPDENSLIESLSDINWQPLQQAHLIGQGECPDILSEAPTPGEILTIQDTGNSLTMDVHSESGGMLVLADTHYPGWIANADGQQLTIFRANLAFRAVQVPAGTQTVRFDYQPWWLIPGVLISSISLLILLALFRLSTPQVIARN